MTGREREVNSHVHCRTGSLETTAEGVNMAFYVFTAVQAA